MIFPSFLIPKLAAIGLLPLDIEEKKFPKEAVILPEPMDDDDDDDDDDDEVELLLGSVVGLVMGFDEEETGVAILRFLA